MGLGFSVWVRIWGVGLGFGLGFRLRGVESQDVKGFGAIPLNYSSSCHGDS